MRGSSLLTPKEILEAMVLRITSWVMIRKEFENVTLDDILTIGKLL